MKAKLAFLVLYATLLTTVKCIKVVEDTNENNTTTVKALSDVENESVKNVTENVNEMKESRTIEDNDDKLPEFQVTTPADIRKIPPTLQNVLKVEQSVKEKPEKSIRDFTNPTPAPIRNNQNSLPEGKLKQAIIHSKQQSFKNLIDKSGKLKDQIARPNEVQADIAVETPLRPTSKEFVPSPELSHFYTPENNIQDHFHPMNQYYRPPLKQDANFPQENSFNLPQQFDAKWLGNNRSPNNNFNPNIVSSHVAPQHGTLRNTQIEFPHHHVDRHVHFHNPYDYHHHYHQFNHFGHHGGSNTGERMVFPNDASPFSDEVKTTPSIPSWPTKIPELNKNERMKGSWKWIPEVEEDSPTIQPESKFQSYHSHGFHYEIAKPQTARDRPYTFESSELFNQHTTPPTGPSSTWSSSSGTAEALVGDEYTTAKDHYQEGEKGKLEIKHIRNPSPWKRFFHVMTAAIPIGIIISALTPRIVYIHPNATAPTLQPPFSQQPFSPPPPIYNPSSPQQPNAQFQQFGPSSPIPLRQRAFNANHFNHHDASESLAEFLKIMETNYREKYDKIDSTCEDRFFCEIALMGADPNADLMHRTLYKVAIETPKAQAEKSGLKEIFTAIKRHNCEVLKCKRT